MQPLLCLLWAIALGAALAGPLYWAMYRANREPETSKPPSHPPDFPFILYLTPACRIALGACAHPSRLRRMTAECIARRIKNATFPAGERPPRLEQFASWPQQAALLCANRLDELAALHACLRERFGEPPAAAAGPVSAEEGAAAPAWLTAMTLGLLLASLLLWLAGQAAQCGRCAALPPPVAQVPPPPPPLPEPEPQPPAPKAVTIAELSTDTFFDYNRNEPMSKAHRERVRAELETLFARYDGIEIIDIAAHTDPIGTNADNEKLGQQRARFVLGVIREIIDSARRPAQFKSTTLPASSTGNGPSAGDFAFWHYCFNEFYLEPKLAAQPLPLKNLAPARSNQRTPCERATAETGRNGEGYPACARLAVPARGKVAPGYPQGAERLRELLACVAPMRHVLIKFRYEQLRSGAIPPRVSLLHKEW